MNLSEIPIPEVYKSSSDFRFFLKWIELCLSEIQYKTDNITDLLDPLRCPSDLIWMLGDTCGYKYDERASIAFNRLVIMYFATLIKYRGSKTGMTLAAELNLDQFNLNNYARENPILAERLEDTSIPVNSVSVTPHPKEGYIDLVYYSENIPTDICTEYVRPLGMYCFNYAGVTVNVNEKITVDARLTELKDQKLSEYINAGPSFVAHYRRSDYASLQKEGLDEHDKPVYAGRQGVFYRNMEYEYPYPNPDINPGLRSLFSLQLCNNEHIFKALLPSLEEPANIFDIGYGPQQIDVKYPDDYTSHTDKPTYNLRINRELEESLSPFAYTVEDARDIMNPKPAVNPSMAVLGDAIALNDEGTAYTYYNKAADKLETTRLDNSGEE